MYNEADTHITIIICTNVGKYVFLGSFNYVMYVYVCFIYNYYEFCHL